MNNRIRLAALAALTALLLPATALAQTADTAPPELLTLLLASWGQWSVVVGLVLLVGIQVWRSFKPDVWDRLHPTVRRLLPPTVSALTTAAVGLASGGTWAEFGRVFVVQWVTLAWAADVLGAGAGAGVAASRAVKLTIAGFVALWLVGCSVTRPAVNAVDSVCAAGLAEHELVQAAASAKGWPLEQTASWLCGFPAVYNAWEQALAQRADPTASAIRAAQEEGLL